MICTLQILVRTCKKIEEKPRGNAGALNITSKMISPHGGQDLRRSPWQCTCQQLTKVHLSVSQVFKGRGTRTQGQQSVAAPWRRRKKTTAMKTAVFIYVPYIPCFVKPIYGQSQWSNVYLNSKSGHNLCLILFRCIIKFKNT